MSMPDPEVLPKKSAGFKTGKTKKLGCFDDLPCLDAGGADINFFDATLFDHRADPLKIGIESSFVQIMCMADIVADHWFFSANSAFF